MKLLSNWRGVLERAWSIRLMILAALLSGGEVAAPYLDGVVDLPQGVFAAMSGLISAAALLARLLAQGNIPDAETPVKGDR